MTKPVSPKQAFLEVREKLDAADRVISAAIQAIETELQEVGVGLPVHCVDVVGVEVWFKKHGGTWRFVVRRGEEDQPLLSAPRHVRAAFFKAVTIDTLFEKATEAYEEELKNRST